MKTTAVVLAALSLLWPVMSYAEGLKAERTIAIPDGVKIRYAAIAPAGDFIAAVCGDQKLRVWNIKSGALSLTLDLGTQRLTSLRISGDSQLLAAGGGEGLVRVWRVASGEVALEFSGPREITGLSFSRDGKVLAAAALEEAVEIRDLSSGKSVVKVRASFSGTTAMMFSPDGRRLATANGDTTIRVYDAQTGALRSTTEDLVLEPLALAYSTDGRTIFTGGGDKTITMIDAESGKVVGSLEKQRDVLGDLRPSKDGKYLAAAYFNVDDPSKPAPVVVWDLTSRKEHTNLTEPQTTMNGGEFLTDGRLMMTSGSVKELKVWSAR